VAWAWGHGYSPPQPHCPPYAGVKNPVTSGNGHDAESAPSERTSCRGPMSEKSEKPALVARSHPAALAAARS
jgi:hypothetical protein